MADRNVRVRLTAEIAGYKRAMEEAAQATRKTKDTTQQAGKAADTALAGMVRSAGRYKEEWNQIGTTTAVAGAAVVAGVGLAVKSYAEFDQAMSAVQAATHESATNMDLLRSAAVEAGADTAFSAGEAANAIEELAKAGVSTKDIMSGGLTGSLDLAAAGAMGVGEAAELAATAMTQFGLEGDKIPHIADLLAAGAGKAQGSVADMGAALKQAGLVANQTGLTIEETTGGLAAFASAGLVGSDAGTSFKSMLQRLTPQSKEAATRMAELGISAYDAQGNFIGLSEFAGVLKDGMKDLTVEERNAAMATIFGSDAVRAAAVLYENGADGVQKWEDAVNDAGFAAETAAMRQDNLRGDLEKLGGSLDSVFLKSGSGANDVLRELTQGVEGLVDTVGSIPAPILSAGLMLTGLAGGAALLGGGLITVIPRILETRQALDVLAPSGSRAGRALSGAGRAARGAAIGFAALAIASEPLNNLGEKATKATGEHADALQRFSGEAAKGSIAADTLNDSFTDLVVQREGVSGLQAAIEGIADPGLWGNIDNMITDTVGAVSLGMINLTSTSEEARARFAGFGEELAALDSESASAAFQSMAENTDGSRESLERLLEYMPAYRDSLEAQAESAGLATDSQTLLGIAMGELSPSTLAAAESMGTYTSSTGQSIPITEELAEALEEVGLSAQGAVVQIGAFAESLVNAGMLTLSARDAERAYEAAIDSLTASLVENGTTMDINTEQGRNNQAALDGIASAGLNAMTAMASTTDSMGNNIYTQDQLQGRLRRTYNDLITAAGSMGITGAEADSLARKVLGIPDDATIDSWVNDYASGKLAQITGAANQIDGRVVTMTTVMREVTERQVIDLGSSPAGTPVRPGQMGRRAHGGAIFGPGTGTSDTAGLYRLSNGEHVLTAQEVDVMGGQAAVYQFRAQLKAGVKGYTEGSAVMSSSVPGYTPGVNSPVTSRPSGPTFGDVTIMQQSDPVATWHEFARRTRNLSV